MSEVRLTGIKACVFDAYGTLFDVNAAAEQAKDLLGERWQPLARTWRAKQLQYTWLRSLAQRHADFWRVTGDALDYALDELNLDDPSLRRRLMELYLRLEAYPEVTDILFGLKEGGLRLSILSNGSPKMLQAAVKMPASLPRWTLSSRRKPSVSLSRILQSTGWPSIALVSQPSRCALSLPTRGTLFPPKLSATACSGATASANVRSESPSAPTAKSPTSHRCPRSFCKRNRPVVQSADLASGDLLNWLIFSKARN